MTTFDEFKDLIFQWVSKVSGAEENRIIFDHSRGTTPEQPYIWIKVLTYDGPTGFMDENFTRNDETDESGERVYSYHLGSREHTVSIQAIGEGAFSRLSLLSRSLTKQTFQVDIFAGKIAVSSIQPVVNLTEFFETTTEERASLDITFAEKFCEREELTEFIEGVEIEDNLIG